MPASSTMRSDVCVGLGGGYSKFKVCPCTVLGFLSGRRQSLLLLRIRGRVAVVEEGGDRDWGEVSEWHDRPG